MIDLATISRNLEQSSDGQWRCKSSSPVSYPEWGNEACFQVEDSSFWFRHRNACIIEALSQYPPAGAVFDVGGGNGFVAKAMQDAGFDVVLVEPGAPGARNAQRRGIRSVVCAGLAEAGFVPASLPAVGLFDVVEHIEDDHEFLRTIRSYLSPRGRVYITVPAYPALWSHEDIDAGHYRRYRKPSLRDLMRNAGFAVEFVTGFFQFLPPAILAARVLPYRLGIAKPAGAHAPNPKMREQHVVHSPLIGKILEQMEQREIAQIRARQETNFGGSWLAVGKAIQ
jgi:SAM-dependent methyltransferase